MSTDLTDAVDRLVEEIADAFGVPRDGLTLPARIRDALAELVEAVASADGGLDYDDGLEAGYDRAVDEFNRDRELLRDRLTAAAGLPSWRWRSLPAELVELLE